MYNPETPLITKTARLILDLGSQRSYITDCLKEKLSIVTAEHQCMTILTFGSERRKEHICDVVEVGMQTKTGTSKLLKLFSVPFVCEPLMCQSISLALKNLDHLQGLDLADESDSSTPLDINILIGSDHHWQLVTSETIKQGDGPVALKTALGWVLLGPLPVAKPTTTLLTTHALKVDSVLGDVRSLDDTCSLSGS